MNVNPDLEDWLHLPINFLQAQINTMDETNELRLYDRSHEVRKYIRNAGFY